MALPFNPANNVMTNRPLASIPGGPNNIPLNPAAGAGAGGGGGVPIDRMMAVLNGVKADPNPKEWIPVMTNLAKTVKDPEIQQALFGIIQAAQFQSPQSPQSKNPQTGEIMASPKTLAEQLEAKLQTLIKGNEIMREVSQKTTQVPQPNQQFQNPMRTSQVIKKKKKTRGNPFKVLMGKVGKLLDHGLTKKQIIRNLSKQKYWNTETIEKAVDLVKDYNKKKNQKEASESIRRIIISEMQEINDFVDTYGNISTADLIMRLEYLNDYLGDAELARDFTEDHPGFVPKNPRKEAGVIERILKERGLK